MQPALHPHFSTHTIWQRWPIYLAGWQLRKSCSSDWSIWEENRWGLKGIRIKKGEEGYELWGVGDDKVSWRRVMRQQPNPNKGSVEKEGGSMGGWRDVCTHHQALKKRREEKHDFGEEVRFPIHSLPPSLPPLWAVRSRVYLRKILVVDGIWVSQIETVAVIPVVCNRKRKRGDICPAR